MNTRQSGHVSANNKIPENQIDVSPTVQIKMMKALK